ncbi:calcium:proton antiporter [Nitratifractor salsuginis]|uniref:Sodium/calcium exchanger membrane region n=1 Tax=Nitratifractor salsuginis (strain DSM 16511 / JCM 12458 / E9I37-1) TaxID=749222 RepID=E6X2B5_NITSE|nr:sodium/hydrogen exchanger [Nitratifractor salsuginis]ADV46050.1 sodium/calcium exchanger membrane region [Nitratifractor salsuginis DSM 16511]
MDSQPPSGSNHTHYNPTLHFLSEYSDIIIGSIFGALAFYFHMTHSPYISVISAAIAIGAFSITVAEIAEILAERLDEPYASFVLTFSAVAVEIILLFMIVREGVHNPAALETVKGGIISAVIVDMNVLLGLAVFIGGLSYKEQEHNEDTSSTYTTILLVASSALLVPSILTYSEDSHTLFEASVMIASMLILFYVAIFIFQTRTHSHFFKATAKSRLFRIKKKHDEEEDEDEDYIFDRLGNVANFFAIFFFILIVGVLAELLASDGMPIAKEQGISTGLAGLIIALIAVAPEIMTAIKAARDDEIQRVINIAMGASTVSVMLTVPILMGLAYFNGIQLTLDFNAFQIGALILTIILAWKTTDDGETNYFEGISHLMFFVGYAIIATLYH